MTLIAAFQVNDNPALLGDFRVTRGGDGFRSTRRKLLRVASNFAIAWTDQLVAANFVARALQSKLDLNAVTIEAVTQVLTNPSIALELAELRVTLLGWVVDETGHHCFRWNSAYPSELFFGAPMYDGVGEDFAKARLGSGNIRRKSPGPFRSEEEQRTRNALFFATHLMLPELVGQSAHDFGHAYEVLKFIEGRGFEYIDNVLYFVVSCRFDSDGRYVSHRLLGSFIKYEVRDDFAIVSSWPVNGSTGVIVDLINPVGEYSVQRGKELMQGFPRHPLFESDYYCTFLHFNAPGFVSPPMAQTISRSDPQFARVIRIREERLEFVVRPQMLERMFKGVRDDMTRAAES
jgi:hypothetical protein